MIEFNKPFLTGKEAIYMNSAIKGLHISGNGPFTKNCQQFLKQLHKLNHCLLTTSCTDALEMASVLCDIQPGDEIIMPSYTFVSTANPFLLRSASIIFADSYADNPNIDPAGIEKLITKRTKAIVPVHYAGVACDMDAIMAIAKKHGLFVIEDAAQAIDGTYKGTPLGSIGHLAAFSFHESKNIVCGEGGLLAVNDSLLAARAEIIWEKGTNRAAFYRGEVDKYGWVDVGSSYLPSDLIAAYLFAQLESLEQIQSKRKEIWRKYHELLHPLEKAGVLRLPVLPDYATCNGHIYYVVCKSGKERSSLIAFLKQKNIQASFHYLGLHNSTFFSGKYKGLPLPNAERFSECLLRLPLHCHLSENDVESVVGAIEAYYKG